MLYMGHSLLFDDDDDYDDSHYLCGTIYLFKKNIQEVYHSFEYWNIF